MRLSGLSAQPSAIDTSNPYRPNSDYTFTINYVAGGLVKVNAYYGADSEPIYTSNNSLPTPSSSRVFGGGVAGYLQATGVLETTAGVNGANGTPGWQTSEDYIGYNTPAAMGMPIEL